MTLRRHRLAEEIIPARDTGRTYWPYAKLREVIFLKQESYPVTINDGLMELKSLDGHTTVGLRYFGVEN